ncbi:hypothetical protein ACO0SA_003198 [Hanseniaspora valbyensis]
MSYLSFDEFKNSSLEEQIKIFDLLFEHTDSLIKFTLQDPKVKLDILKCDDYKNMIELVRSSLLSLTENDSINDETKTHLSNIIEAHPKLGVPKEIQGELSALSKMEQKNLSSNTNNNNSEEIKEALIDLNNKYEKKYKGLRFVCFVNGRDRVEIIQEMKQILQSENTWLQECQRAINAMCDIALDRAKKLDL